MGSGSRCELDECSRAIILNDTSNVTDRVFAIFSKLCKTFKPKFQGVRKIYEMGLRSKIMRVNLFKKVLRHLNTATLIFKSRKNR